MKLDWGFNTTDMEKIGLPIFVMPVVKTIKGELWVKLEGQKKITDKPKTIMRYRKLPVKTDFGKNVTFYCKESK